MRYGMGFCILLCNSLWYWGSSVVACRARVANAFVCLTCTLCCHSQDRAGMEVVQTLERWVEADRGRAGAGSPPASGSPMNG
jgi:hypothetical protein